MYTTPNIALVGAAGSGKSTLANLLIARHNYARVSLANPLKLEVARWFLGPLASPSECFAWAEAHKPELRGLYQAYGLARRDITSKDYWLRMAFLAAATFNASSRPVVVDDCRFLNEAFGFTAADWFVIRIHRAQPEGDTITREQRQHVSEREAQRIEAHFDIYNDGDYERLYRQWQRLAQPGGMFQTFQYVYKLQRQQQEGGR